MVLLFEAVRSAFVEPDRCAEPLLRREYMKLIGAVAGRPDLFGKAEKAHLDVYRVIGHVQNEMGTDDNFQFNKVSTEGSSCVYWNGLNAFIGKCVMAETMRLALATVINHHQVNRLDNIHPPLALTHVAWVLL